MTLTFKLDLDILTLDLPVHAKIQVRMCVRLALRVVTDRHTDDVNTIIPDMSQTWGVIKAHTSTIRQ